MGWMGYRKFLILNGRLAYPREGVVEMLTSIVIRTGILHSNSDSRRRGSTNLGYGWTSFMDAF